MPVYTMKRRDFLKYSAIMPLAAAATRRGFAMPRQNMQPDKQPPDTVTLFVAGDVMTGRGIDQVLPNPGDPTIFEAYTSSARDYVQLAERANGTIPRPVDFTWIWGDALAALEAAAPDVRIVNLETAVTRTGSPWPYKGIQYRMHPANIPCLTAAAIDCCVLANNHVLDWGYAGLEETLASLAQADLPAVGAGPDLAAAQAPAIFDLPGRGRVLVFAGGLQSSGIPAKWAATRERPGLHLLPDLSDHTIRDIAHAVRTRKRPGDVVVISLHWGGNWGYSIPAAHSGRGTGAGDIRPAGPGPVLVFAGGLRAAASRRSGRQLVNGPASTCCRTSGHTIRDIAHAVRTRKRPGDVVVSPLGGNWAIASRRRTPALPMR